jgi:hypothetical protein
MELSGKVVKIINEKRDPESKELSLQEFILQPETSRNMIKLTLYGTKAAKYAVKIGDEIEAIINIVSTEVNSNWFTSVYVNYLIDKSERFTKLEMDKEKANVWKIDLRTEKIIRKSFNDPDVNINEVLNDSLNAYCYTAQLENSIRKGWLVREGNIVSLTDKAQSYTYKGVLLFEAKPVFEDMIEQKK